MEDMSIAVLAAQSILGLYGALYVGTAIYAPSWFLDTLALKHMESRQRSVGRVDPGVRWWFWPVAIVTLLAVGTLVYAATAFVVAVIPYDLGNIGEDGEWVGLRSAVQGIVAVMGGLSLPSRLEKNAEVLVSAAIIKSGRPR